MFTFDIDPAMVERTRHRAEEARLANVKPALRDVIADGFGLPRSRSDQIA